MSTTVSSSSRSSPASLSVVGTSNGNENDFPAGAGPGLTSSASLYLYTFLATLVLLLLVSATIVFRTWALRRRQRALIAEAIANGTYVPPTKPGVGERPKIYEVHVGDLESLEEQAEESRQSVEKVKEKEKQREVVGSAMVQWAKTMPVAGTWLNPREEPIAPVPPTPDPTPMPRSRFHWLRWPRRGRRQPLLPTSSPSEPLSPTTPHAQPLSHTGRPSQSAELIRASVSSTEKPPLTPEPPPEMVRVVVLVTMPFSETGRRKTGDDAEPELPYMEFGVVEVCADGIGEALDTPTAASQSKPESRVALPQGSNVNVVAAGGA